MKRFLSAVLPLFAFLFFQATNVHSATITVTSTADPGTAGTCTLRQAISVLNASSVAGTSCVNSGGAFGSSDTINFNGPLTGTITLGSTLTTPGAGKNYTVNAPTLAITINGNGNRIFNLTTNATLSLSGLTFTGAAAGSGGAIDVGATATLTVTNSLFLANAATAPLGGGQGGAIRNSGGTVTVINATFSGNTCTGDGGALRNSSGTMTLNNVTISQNSTGGGLVGGNDGGGISIGGGTVTISNSIVAGNTLGTPLTGTNVGPDCNGTLTSAGYNLIGDVSNCTFAPTTGDITNLNPQLGALGNNGGTTFTYALSSTSPAVNAGNPAAVGAPPNCAATDQRGTARPQVGVCDIGAYELAATQLHGTLEFSAPSYSVNETTGSTTVTVTVNRKNGSKGQLTVDYKTTDGTALAGTNYTAIPTGTLTFPDGSTASQTFNVTILDDPNAEATTSFFVSLNNLTGGATLGGPSSAEVFIFDNDAPGLAIMTGPAAFSATVGSTQTQTVTLQNTGNVDVTIGQADVIGPNLTAYTIPALTDFCSGQTVVPGGTCNFDITFAPSTTGTLDAQIRFPSDDPNSPLLVAVTGTGNANAVATTTPANGSTLSFGTLSVNSTSPAQTVELRNTGTTPLTLGTPGVAINGGGEFAFLLNSCSDGLQLAPGQTCLVEVVFKPTVNTAQPATTLDFTTDGGNPSLNLTGQGQFAPQATVTPSPSLDFGTLAPLQKSIPLQVELRSTGTEPLTLDGTSAVSVSGTAFAILTNTCTNGLVLNVGSTCLVTLQYTPPGPGNTSDAETLTFTNDSGGTAGATQAVSLTGTGQVGPIATPTPNSQDFGTLSPLATSVPYQVELRNTGSTPLTLDSASAVVVSGTAFTIQTNTCLNSLVLQPGQICLVTLQYTPPGPGNTSDAETLTFTDDDGGTAGSTQVVNLTGTGQVGPIATTTPSSQDFGTLPPGVSSVPFQVELRNTGTTALTLDSANAVAVSGTAFTIQTNTCLNSLVLQPGQICLVTLQYTPPGPGNTSDAETLTFTDDDGGTAGSTQVVNLTGTGQVGPIATTNPPDTSTVAFGSQVVGKNGGVQVIQLTNTGTTTLTLGSPGVTLSGSTDFSLVSNNCSDNLTLAPHEDCVVLVGYTPTAVGGVAGTLNFASDGGTSTVNLSGTGVAAGANPSPTSLSFGNQALNTTSAPLSVTITNSGTQPLHTSGAIIVGPRAGDFNVASDNCSTAAVAPAASCTVSAVFTPHSLGAVPAGTFLKIINDAPNSPILVSLSGTGVAAGTATANANPTSLVFNAQVVGTPSAAQNVQISNGGTIPLQLSGLFITGANANSFVVSSDGCTGTTVNPGSSCTISVAASPVSAGDLTASVTLISNASNSPTAIALSAPGVTVPSSGGGGGGCSLTPNASQSSSTALWIMMASLAVLAVARRRHS